MSAQHRLLIVEDDPEMGMGLQDYFMIEGFEVTLAQDGEAGLQHITALPPFDLAILDVMMPKRSGFEVLREARSQGVHTPVILLTAKGQENDKLHGFSMGADDYLTKPFSAEELLARVRAVLRRSLHPDAASLERYQFGLIEVNFGDHTASRNGDAIQFTALEFEILKYFIQHKGRTVSRKQLLRDVWGISGDITTRTIDRHVASLRKKVEPDANIPTHIETVYGIGYKFVG